MNNRTEPVEPSEFFKFCDELRGKEIYRRNTHELKYKYQVFKPEMSFRILRQLLTDTHPDFYLKDKRKKFYEFPP